MASPPHKVSVMNVRATAQNALLIRFMRKLKNAPWQIARTLMIAWM